MIRKKNIICLSLGLMILFTGLFSISADAATSVKEENTNKYVFAVPDAGWTVVTVNAIYREKYTSNASKNTFYIRDKILFYQHAGLGTIGVSPLDVKHSNGRVFSEWKHVDTIWGGEWEFGLDYSNTESVTYGKSDGITANFPYTVACLDANPPIQAGGVKVSLNTK